VGYSHVGIGVLPAWRKERRVSPGGHQPQGRAPRHGGPPPGARAGNAPSRYLTYVMNRLNTVGAVYLLFVALIPTVLIMALGLNAKLPFGGTTILIIAGVGLDTLRQAKAQTEQFQYTGFLLENVDHKEGARAPPPPPARAGGRGPGFSDFGRRRRGGCEGEEGDSPVGCRLTEQSVSSHI